MSDVSWFEPEGTDVFDSAEDRTVPTRRPTPCSGQTTAQQFQAAMDKIDEIASS